MDFTIWLTILHIRRLSEQLNGYLSSRDLIGRDYTLPGGCVKFGSAPGIRGENLDRRFQFPAEAEAVNFIRYFEG